MQEAGREDPMWRKGEAHTGKIVRMPWNAIVLTHALEASEPVAEGRKVPTQVDAHLDSQREEEFLGWEGARLEC